MAGAGTLKPLVEFGRPLEEGEAIKKIRTKIRIPIVSVVSEGNYSNSPLISQLSGRKIFHSAFLADEDYFWENYCCRIWDTVFELNDSGHKFFMCLFPHGPRIIRPIDEAFISEQLGEASALFMKAHSKGEMTPLVEAELYESGTPLGLDFRGFVASVPKFLELYKDFQRVIRTDRGELYAKYPGEVWYWDDDKLEPTYGAFSTQAVFNALMAIYPDKIIVDANEALFKAVADELP